jgi:glycosyltransferase involved in cell wall biosynthesis
MTMRIALLLHDLHLGGAERQALHLAVGLRARGRDVVVAALGADGPLRDTCADVGVACAVCRLAHPLSPFYLPFNLCRAAHALRRLRPDAVVAYTSVPNLYGALAWRAAGARTFVWNQRSAGLYRPPRAAEAAAVRCTPVFAANATSSADFLVHALGVAPERIRRVPNGIALPPRRQPTGAWRRHLGADKADCVACMIGNVRAPKDHAGLLDAWEIVRRRCARRGIRAWLWLVGRVHADGEGVRRRVTATPGDNGVRLAGFQEDVAGLLADADIGVFASRSEGQPNGVLECMAAGLPVAATDLPGIRDCLDAEQIPYLSEIGDVYAMAENILCLVTDPAERRRLGEANRARVEREFSVSMMVERMTELIDETAIL